MKMRVLVYLLLLFMFHNSILSVYAADETLITSPHGVLMEAATGTVIYEKDKDSRVSPASITKIMTLILIFDELEKGTISLSDQVITSSYAKSMGGSQVFLEEGEQQTVETLIKCIVIASGNDASVAMAEHISGNETEFVSKMNERAKGLGMNNTNFEDCCGLTESTNHYTSAYDVALMSKELITKYPKILEYSSVWMEDITHTTAKGTSPFTLTNTNKLLRGYEGCVGLKTGSTSLAKYCVSTVAKRDSITLISVVMTAPDYKVRFKDAAAMLDYGFNNCKLYIDDNDEKLPMIHINGGLKQDAICSFENKFTYLDTNGQDLSSINKKIEIKSSIDAPVKKGTAAGYARYYLNDKEIGNVRIVLAESIEKAAYSDYVFNIIGKWLL